MTRTLLPEITPCLPRDLEQYRRTVARDDLASLIDGLAEAVAQLAIDNMALKERVQRLEQYEIERDYR